MAVQEPLTITMNKTILTMDSKVHQQDVDGCDDVMCVLEKRLRIVACSHTEGDFDRYDMDWTAITDEGSEMSIAVENKDRRWGWMYDDDGNAERDYDKPQYSSTYDSQMFNFEKYEYLMELRNKTGAEIGYTSDYLDGVWLFDLKTLPKEMIYKPAKEGGWKIMVLVREKTMDGRTEKKLQPRFLIPNQYGDFYKR